MDFTIFIAAVVVAVLLTIAFAATYRGDGSWAGLWVFFALIFLFAVAGGIWTAPYGPVYWGVPWFGIIFWGVLVALLLAAVATPSRRRALRASAAPEPDDTPIVLGIIFWILLVLLVVSIVWGFAFR